MNGIEEVTETKLKFIKGSTFICIKQMQLDEIDEHFIEVGTTSKPLGDGTKAIAFNTNTGLTFTITPKSVIKLSEYFKLLD